MSRPELFLKKREERRIRVGHPWIFSNEVDATRTPLASFTAGDMVDVMTSSGRHIASAYVNPHALICGRVVARAPNVELDFATLAARIDRALALRERLYEKSFYRLVYAESDALPGLVVDRYGDVLVVQLTTAGMEQVREAIVSALDARLKPKAIILRNDGRMRQLERLASYVETVVGEAPEAIEIVEGDARFKASPLEGQKTGWYFDHRENRQLVSRYAEGQRVLDVFSYVGAWGIQALTRGAKSAHCVDSSEAALAKLKENAVDNGCANKLECRGGDAFDAMKHLRDEGRQFGVVVLDPPAFARRKKDRESAMEAYTRLNKLAMALVEEGGLLATASCSSHITRGEFVECVSNAARTLKRQVQILYELRQGPDHPVHPILPESEYLKGVLVRVCASD